jgi:hypothetical protein
MKCKFYVRKEYSLALREVSRRSSTCRCHENSSTLPLKRFRLRVPAVIDSSTSKGRIPSKSGVTVATMSIIVIVKVLVKLRSAVYVLVIEDGLSAHAIPPAKRQVILLAGSVSNTRMNPMQPSKHILHLSRIWFLQGWASKRLSLRRAYSTKGLCIIYWPA